MPTGTSPSLPRCACYAACNLPLKATRVYKDGDKETPGQLVIINLQKTQVGRVAGWEAG